MLEKLGRSFILAIESPLEGRGRYVCTILNVCSGLIGNANYVISLRRHYFYSATSVVKSYIIRKNWFISSWDGQVEKAWLACFRFIEFWMGLPYIKSDEVEVTLAGIAPESRLPGGAIDTEYVCGASTRGASQTLVSGNVVVDLDQPGLQRMGIGECPKPRQEKSGDSSTNEQKGGYQKANPTSD